MNYEPERLHQLLRDTKGQRSQRWLATQLNVTEKTVAEWLRGGGIQGDNIAHIEDLARREQIEPALYQRPRLIWDFRRSYEDNLNTPVPEPPRVPPLEDAVTTILGYPVNGVVGASASVITSSAQLVRYLCNVGLDIIVYKTVRSRHYKAHPGTNAFVCDDIRPLTQSGEQRPYHVTGVENAPSPFKALINRYGMPSADPEQWTIDFQAAGKHVNPGQLLILSVTGSGARNDPPETLVKDFSRVVGMARDAGAKAVELNLSCPNCSGREGEVFKDLDTTLAICRAARTAAGQDIKLLIKIGYLPKAELLSFVRATVEHVDGYSAINSYPVEAQRDGQTGPENAFGQTGLKAGLTGRPILPLGLATVTALRDFRDEEGADFCILGSGGVIEPSDVLNYLDAGADAVMLATALYSDPLLALRARPLWQQRRNSLPNRAELVELARFAWSRAMSSSQLQIHDPDVLSIAASQVWVEVERNLRAAARTTAHRGVGTTPRIPTEQDFRRMIADRARRNRYDS